MNEFFRSINEELDLESKATLVELPVFFGTDQPEQFFDFARWKQHKSQTRYGRLLLGILFGITTRRILLIVVLLTLFSGLVGVYNSAAPGLDLPELALPLTPFELTAPVLGLLLVFRTNSAYERFSSGNTCSWEVTGQMRNIIRIIMVYATSQATPVSERKAAWDLIDALCLLHGWLMTGYLKGAPNSGQQAAVLRAVVGDSKGEALSALQSNELSFFALSATISLSVARRLPSMRKEDRVLFESDVSKLTTSLGTCEQLLRTPIPLGYTRYSVRFLWIWLTLLPFSLYRTFEPFSTGTWWEDKPKPVLAFAMLFIGFIFLSIEDIAVQIEEPFAILPLRQHQKWLIRDVRQMQAVVKAFVSDIGGGDDGEEEEVAEEGEVIGGSNGSAPPLEKRQRQ